MTEEPRFIENPSAQLVSQSQKLLTNSLYNMGKVTKTSYSSELTHREKLQKIDLISFVEKEPKLGLWKASKEKIADWGRRFGNESVKKNRRRGESAEILFQQEIDNILVLNAKGNIHIPRITDHRQNYYKMEFVRGVSGEIVVDEKPNLETKLLIVKQTLDAVYNVFKDGVVNMEYAPKNSIIIPNLKTGVPENVMLIDFGVSFQVDLEGRIVVDMDLFNKSGVRINQSEDGVGIFPPELTGKTGKVKVDAEKCLVWSLAHRVATSWLTGEKVKEGYRGLMRRSRSINPDDRPSLVEFISFFKEIEIDESKVASCIPEDILKSNQEMLGRPDTEISIDERQVDRIIEELKKLKDKQK